MATAKKLPSGSWRCLVYDYTDENGKRVYKSFTSSDTSSKGKREAEFLAAQYAASKKVPSENKTTNITFGEALDLYIENREPVLSPCTIRDYKRIRRNDLKSLMNMKIFDITQDDIQRAVNDESKAHSPKTVRNGHGLISAVLKHYRPEFALNTILPKKVRPNLYIPVDEDIKKLLLHVKDSEMELPILLAAFGPMRRGEICALDSSDISGNVVHVRKNMVRNIDSQWIIKQPKSYAGDRYIDYPLFVSEKFVGIKGRITTLLPYEITNSFSDILKAAGVPHFRFHDLRHYAASILHALNIPDAYIMQRGGWSSDGVLKNVYRHTLSDQTISVTQKANQHFEELYRHT